MATLLSFKDVGIQGVTRTTVPAGGTSLIPIGFKTPLEIDEGGNNVFKMHYDLKDQIADNLRNLVLTNHGERLALYDFGADLRPLLSDWTNKEDFDAEAMRRIKTAANKYMPFVELQGYDSRPDYEENIFMGKLKMFIAYSIPNLGLSNQMLELHLFVM